MMASPRFARKTGSHAVSPFQECLCLGPHTLSILEPARLVYIDECPIKLTPLEYILF